MMDADTSGHSDISICSDDTEFLLGQNVSIREIDDDDVIHAHENVKIPLSVGKSYHSSPQCSPQKLQQVNSSNLRSPQRKGRNTKPGKGQDVIQRSPGNSKPKQSSAEESFKSNIKTKADKKSQPRQNYVPKENLKGQTPQTSYGSEPARYNKDGERTPKSKKQVPDNLAKHPHGVGNFQSPESHKSIHAHQNVIGSPTVKSESPYKSSQLIPPSRDKANAKRKQVEFGRSLLREHYIPGNQNNWEIDSEISLELVNGEQKFVETESNDLESQMSEATEDLMAGQDEDEEDFTEKLKELNLAVNYDAGTNGE